MESSYPVVLLRNVSYIYPGSSQAALLDLSMELFEGEVLAVLGATGAGKTTLCQLLQGLVPNFYGGRFFGEAIICGFDTVEKPVTNLAGLVASVFQDPQSQLLTTSVENEVAFGLENLGVPRDKMRIRIAEALDLVGLTGINQKHPQELSGGQQQRLALAAALAIRPRLLVLDEPTAQLDPLGSEMIFSHLKSIRTQYRAAMVIASHAAEELAELADKVIVLSNGSIVRMGTPSEVFSDCTFLSEHHIRAPQVAETFWELKALGAFSKDVPINLSEGYQALDTLPEPTHLAKDNELLPQSHPERETLVSFDSVSYSYPDGTKALQDISFQVYAGEYLVIAGHNGAGKSTVCRLLLELVRPNGGSVWFKRSAVSAASSLIGYVPQNPDVALFCGSVRDEVALALQFRGIPPSETQSHVAACAADMGLTDKLDAHPLSLPKGDRARVVIAAVLAMQPDILVFDEPTTGQDLQGAHQILEVTRRLNASGKTVIVVTHHLHFVSPYADRLLLLGAGTVLGEGSLHTMYQRIDLLHATSVTPPQTALLGQYWSHRTGQKLSALTPTQLATELSRSFIHPQSC